MRNETTYQKDKKFELNLYMYTLNFFNRIQSYLNQKLLVLNFQRKSESVNNATQNLKKFTDPVKMFRFVDEPEI